MNSNRGLGFTLIELMISCALSAMFFGVTATFTAQVWRSGKTVDDYVSDLAHCRRALQRTEADLRLARRLETVGGVQRLHLEDRHVDYQVLAGVLTRTVDGRSEAIARRIGIFEMQSRGRLVDLRVGPMRRSKVSTSLPQIFTTVCLREAGR